MQPEGTAELIVANAKVATLDSQDRMASAVAIAGGRFLAVGDEAEIGGLARAGTRRVDAGGKLVVPGLIDGHAHMDREGLKDALPSLSGCACIPCPAAPASPTC